MDLSTLLCHFIILAAGDIGGFVKSEVVDNDKPGFPAQFKPDNFHIRLKRNELERYFGVSSPKEVPEYEVISPIQVDEDNRFLSHDLNIHARHKRHAEEPRVWYYNVQAFGMSLHLNLTKNEELMSPWLTVERHENGTVTNEDPPHNTFFNGHVDSEPGSLVAVSNGNGLMGIIQLMSHTLFLQPLASHFVPDRNAKINNHLIYRRSIDEKNTPNRYKAREKKDVIFVKESQQKIEGSEEDDDLKYLEMTLVADKYTISFYGNDTTKYLLMLANLLNTIYHDDSIGKKKITISIVQIKLVKDGLDYYSNTGNPAKISALKNWAKVVKIPTSDSNPSHPDVISLVTRGGLGGLADVNSICKRMSFTVNNDMGLATVFILAHETAHTLGVSHDGGSSSCPNYQYVMAGSVPGGKMAGKWSSCSKLKIQSLLSNAPCLEEVQQRKNSYLKIFQNKLPGKIITGDKQCKQQYGKGYWHCKQKQSDCGSLFCTSNGWSCYSKVAPPLDGTYCAPRHWCIGGECVDDGSQIIDGGWSKWGSYSTCSQTCGGGIQRRSRTCTNPRPQNGGKNCNGESRGLPRMCNVKPCPVGSKDYRLVQCQAYDAAYTVYYKGGGYACNLYCRHGRFIAYPKGIVKDGTRCQYGQVTNKDICIGGKCVPVGCDYGIESGFSFDRCGVCNGDSTKCTQVMKTYTDDWTQNGLENAGLVCVVSRGSKEIWMYENASDKNAIAVQDAKKNYLIVPPKGQRMKAAGSTIIYGKKSGREFVFIPGPINQTLRFMFIYKGAANQGVLCKYLKPQKSVISSSDVEWIIDEKTGWSACSKTCAGGKKTRLVKCKRKDDQSVVADRVCERASKKPQDEMPCNTQACTAKWYLSGWSSCSKTCGRGVRTRELSCRTKVSHDPEEYKTVKEVNCKGLKPKVFQKACYKVTCPAEWVPSPWGKCSKTCGGGIITRILSCKKLNKDGQYSPVPKIFCQNAVKPPVNEACNDDIPCFVKKYRSLGCYREDPHKHLLPVMEHSFRSGGITWKKIELVVEACYQIVKDTKYKIFGVKFYGECWVGKTPSPEFKTSLGKCYKRTVGKAHTYYIYEILYRWEKVTKFAERCHCKFI